MKDPNPELGCVSGGVWSTPPVCEEPVINLVRWRVVEVKSKEGLIERHYVGYNIGGFEGRVSTAMCGFNPETARGTTESGRIYQLIGPAGYDADAEYVWRLWSAANEVTEERDVSMEVEQLIREVS